jgi:hypothetical protein
MPMRAVVGIMGLSLAALDGRAKFSTFDGLFSALTNKQHATNPR